MKRKTDTQLTWPVALLSSATQTKFALAPAIVCALGLVWSGCSSQRGHQQQARRGGSQQQQQQQQPKPKPPLAAPPHLLCTEPTLGLIRMIKTMPNEVVLGKEFLSELSLTAQACAANVVVRDGVPANVSFVRSEPAATTDHNQLTWQIGDIDAGETRSIKVWLKADREGNVVNCASVSADPRTCGTNPGNTPTRVVNPAIELTKTQPAEANICEPIPVTLTVKNSGTSQLTGVKVSDTLPAGLTSDGKNSLVFDAGNLTPGESKEFKFVVNAGRAGEFVNPAEATSDQGISAKASATTTVGQAVLAITCKSREQQYLTRPFDVCFTVSNTGNAPALGTLVVVPIPADLTFNSATAGGHVSGNNIIWDLGALAPNSPQEVCASFTSARAGNYSFAASAKGPCAAPVSTTCETRTIGVTALLLEETDNPDPIQIGETTTYAVKVTNQGTADDTNVKVVVEFPAEIDPVSASNGGTVSGKKVTFPAYPRLSPKQSFEFTVTAKGVKVGDARVTFIRTSDGIPAPTTAEESTRVY